MSIIIPTFGRDGILCETIRSLLELKESASEILVLDQTPEHDHATSSRLAQWHAECRIGWIRLDRPSIPCSMNMGLREAKGDVVLFLDDDIIPSPSLIAAHRRVYEQFPEAWAAVGRVLQPEDVEKQRKANRAEQTQRKDSTRRTSTLRLDLDFAFNRTVPSWVENVIACNLSVRRERFLAIGGFDANFIPPVSFRFETEFAKRLVAKGGRIRFEPAASIRHLRAASGGTRSHGSHLTSGSPIHGVGDYYYALRWGSGWDRAWYIAKRPFREVRTKFHLRHPWWIPLKFFGEIRAIGWAFALARRGPRLLPDASRARPPAVGIQS